MSTDPVPTLTPPKPKDPELVPKVILTALLSIVAIIVVFACYFKFFANPPAPSPTPEQQLARFSEILQETRQHNIEAAVRAGKIIPGMTKYDIQQSRGLPDERYQGDGVDFELRQKGVTEYWRFYNADGTSTYVFLGYDGTVKLVNESVR